MLIHSVIVYNNSKITLEVIGWIYVRNRPKSALALLSVFMREVAISDSGARHSFESILFRQARPFKPG